MGIWDSFSDGADDLTDGVSDKTRSVGNPLGSRDSSVVEYGDGKLDG